VDLRSLGLLERKRVLRHVLNENKPASVFYADHIEQAGTGLFQVVCQKDCEGIVAKHRLAPYVATPATWFKILNPEYSQKHGRRELFDKFRARTEPISTAKTAVASVANEELLSPKT
jgi:hypothetical protein